MHVPDRLLVLLLHQLELLFELLELLAEGLRLLRSGRTGDKSRPRTRHTITNTRMATLPVHERGLSS